MGAVGAMEIAQAFAAVSRTSMLDSKASPTKEFMDVKHAKKKNMDTSHFFLNRVPRRPN